MFSILLFSLSATVDFRGKTKPEYRIPASKILFLWDSYIYFQQDKLEGWSFFSPQALIIIEGSLLFWKECRITRPSDGWIWVPHPCSRTTIGKGTRCEISKCHIENQLSAVSDKHLGSVSAGAAGWGESTWLHLLPHFIKINSWNIQVSIFNQNKSSISRVWNRCEYIWKICVSVNVWGCLAW